MNIVMRFSSALRDAGDAEADGAQQGKREGRVPLLLKVSAAPCLERKQFTSLANAANGHAHTPRSPIDRILKKRGLLVEDGAEESADEGHIQVPLTFTVSTRYQLQIASINLTSNVGRSLLAKLPVSFLVAIEFRSCSLVDTALDALQTCPRLRYLSLANNALRCIPKLGHMRSLQFLDLDENSIDTLSSVTRLSIYTLLPRSLRYLSLRRNPISEDAGQHRPLLTGLHIFLLALDGHIVADEERLNLLFDSPYCAGHPRMRVSQATTAYPSAVKTQKAQQGKNEVVDPWERAYGSLSKVLPESPRTKQEAEVALGEALSRRLDLQLRCLQRQYSCTNPVPMMQRMFRIALRIRREKKARLPPRSLRLLVKLQATVRRFLLLSRIRVEMDALLLAGADKQDLLGGSGASGGGGAGQALLLRLKFFVHVLCRWWRRLSYRRLAIKAARVVQRSYRWCLKRRARSLAYIAERRYTGVVVPVKFEGEVLRVLTQLLRHPTSSFSVQPLPHTYMHHMNIPTTMQAVRASPYHFQVSSQKFLKQLDRQHQQQHGQRRFRWSLWYSFRLLSAGQRAPLIVLRRRGCSRPSSNGRLVVKAGSIQDSTTTESIVFDNPRISATITSTVHSPQLKAPRFQQTALGLSRFAMSPAMVIELVRALRREKSASNSKAAHTPVIPIWFDGEVARYAAAVSIQRFVRGMQCRRAWSSFLLARCLDRRAAILLQRWTRSLLGIVGRFKMLRYVSSVCNEIDGRCFYLDVATFYRLLRASGSESTEVGEHNRDRSVFCYPEYSAEPAGVDGRLVVVSAGSVGDVRRAGPPRWCSWCPPHLASSSYVESSHSKVQSLVEVLTVGTKVTLRTLLLPAPDAPAAAAKTHHRTTPESSSLTTPLVDALPSHQSSQCLRLVRVGCTSLHDARCRAALLMIYSHRFSGISISSRLGEELRPGLKESPCIIPLSERAISRSLKSYSQRAHSGLLARTPTTAKGKAKADSSFKSSSDANGSTTSPSEMSCLLAPAPIWLASAEALQDPRDIIRARFLMETLAALTRSAAATAAAAAADGSSSEGPYWAPTLRAFVTEAEEAVDVDFTLDDLLKHGGEAEPAASSRRQGKPVPTNGGNDANANSEHWSAPRLLNWIANNGQQKRNAHIALVSSTRHQQNVSHGFASAVGLYRGHSYEATAARLEKMIRDREGKPVHSSPAPAISSSTVPATATATATAPFMDAAFTVAVNAPAAITSQMSTHMHFPSIPDDAFSDGLRTRPSSPQSPVALAREPIRDSPDSRPTSRVASRKQHSRDKGDRHAVPIINIASHAHELDMSPNHEVPASLPQSPHTHNPSTRGMSPHILVPTLPLSGYGRDVGKGSTGGSITDSSALGGSTFASGYTLAARHGKGKRFAPAKSSVSLGLGEEIDPETIDSYFGSGGGGTVDDPGNGSPDKEAEEGQVELEGEGEGEEEDEVYESPAEKGPATTSVSRQKAARKKLIKQAQSIGGAARQAESRELRLALALMSSAKRDRGQSVNNIVFPQGEAGQPPHSFRVPGDGGAHAHVKAAPAIKPSPPIQGTLGKKSQVQQSKRVTTAAEAESEQTSPRGGALWIADALGGYQQEKKDEPKVSAKSSAYVFPSEFGAFEYTGAITSGTLTPRDKLFRSPLLLSGSSRVAEAPQLRDSLPDTARSGLSEDTLQSILARLRGRGANSGDTEYNDETASARGSLASEQNPPSLAAGGGLYSTLPSRASSPRVSTADAILETLLHPRSPHSADESRQASRLQGGGVHGENSVRAKLVLLEREGVNLPKIFKRR